MQPSTLRTRLWHVITPLMITTAAAYVGLALPVQPAGMSCNRANNSPIRPLTNGVASSPHGKHVC